MKTQTYYNTSNENEANICNTSDKLCVNCAGVVNKTYGVINKSRRKDYYILYMTEGEMFMEIDNKKLCISEGQLIIIKPGTLYSYYGVTGKKVQYLWIHFSGNEAKNTVFNFNLMLNTVMNIGVRQKLFECWRHIFYEFLKNDEFFSESSCCILKQILIMFSRYANSNNKKQQFLKSLFYIHEHFEADICIRDLSELENLSETHFRSEFKKSFGVSPKEYVINLRIETACMLLSESDICISEAARLVGYADPYYFSRIFKKKTGISPLQYKNKSRIDEKN